VRFVSARRAATRAFAAALSLLQLTSLVEQRRGRTLGHGLHVMRCRDMAQAHARCRGGHGADAASSRSADARPRRSRREPVSILVLI
jgi:hypothetical protein